MTSRYIGTRGQILRRSGVRLQDFSYSRLSIIVGTLLVLFVTNPANYVSLTLPFPISSLLRRKRNQSTSISSSSNDNLESKNLGTLRSKWLGIEINISSLSERESSRRTSSSSGSSYTNKLFTYNSRHFRNGTNYHIFALARGTRGVDLGMMGTKITICTFDGIGRRIPQSSQNLSQSLSSSLCYWVADNLCHNYEIFDPKQRAFTMFRLMQVLKIGSLLLQSCYIYRDTTPLFPKISLRHVLQRPSSLFFSLFHEPYSLKDFLSFSVYLYPSLVTLEKVAYLHSPNDQTAAVHFYGIAFALLFLIGSIANLLSSYVVSSKTGGMKGSIASCLGFLSSVKPHAIVIEWFDVQLTASDALFSTFAVTLISSLFGITSIAGGEWDINNVISWAFGGVLGYAMGEYKKNALQPWLLYFFS